MPKISVVIPFHWMDNWQFFLTRCLESIESQTFKDYEVILEKVGSMPVTSNRVINDAKGEFIKVLYMDDWLAHPNVLAEIVEAMDPPLQYTSDARFQPKWLISGADTNPSPYWTDDIETGNNKLGSPSALTVRRDCVLLFDEKLSWLLDCDLYKRLYEKLGKPFIRQEIDINIGQHKGQMTHIMSDDYKLSEQEYVRKKYEKSSINGS